MSIRQKSVALLLLIGLVPTLVVSSVAFITISRELNKRTASQLASIDTKQQQTVNTMLQGNQEEVIKLSNAFDFQTALGEYLASRSPANKARVAAILQDKFPGIPGISMIHIASLDSKVLISTKASREGQELNVKAPDAGTAEGPVISIAQDLEGVDRLFITTPLQINKKESAIVQVVFKIDNLVAAIQDYTGLGSTGETVVQATIGSGKTVSLLPLRFGEGKTNQVPYTYTNNGKIVDYRGKEVLVFTRPVGFSDWTIATKIDTEEALATITQLRNSLIWIVLISSLIIIIIAVYITRIFTSPILQLATASQRIGRGDFDARVYLNEKDELGTLAGSINAMGDSLKSFVHGIESQRNHLSVILNSTNDTIMALDKEGTITTANQPAAELTGKSLPELVGKNFNDIFKLYSDSQPVKINLAAPGTNSYAKLEYLNAGDSRHYIRVIVATLSGQASEKDQIIVTIHDETKSRELENMKVDFVSMAAHELRTPLAAIKGYLELILFKLKEVPPEITTYLQQSLKSAVELGSLINNLLDVSRIERGTLTLNMVKTDLANIMARAIKDVGFISAEKGIKLNFHGPEKDFMVVADEIALKEVISNLLTNAVKYTPAEGKVDAYLEQQGEHYHVRVKDSGIGIPKDAQAHLFTKFFRVKGGLASGSSGTGLGLFIAKSIIERHGGHIKAESEEGKGSTFSFSIPVLTNERLAEIQAEEQAKETTTRRHRGWITKNTSR